MNANNNYRIVDSIYAGCHLVYDEDWHEVFRGTWHECDAFIRAVETVDMLANMPLQDRNDRKERLYYESLYSQIGRDIGNDSDLRRG